jgi:SAM-dependent methyltransferase
MRSDGAYAEHNSVEAYDRHVGRYSGALACELMAVAGLREGQRALEVGCGPGALTDALARRLGPRSVAAVDLFEPWVCECRARVPGADIRHGAAEQLPFPNDAFDVVLSQLVLNFLGDADRSLQEMRRVARPGAVVAACAWDYAGGMTMLRKFWDAAIEIDPKHARERDGARTMRYCRAPELRELWERSGLIDVVVGELAVSAEYADFDDLWSPFAIGMGHSGAYAASLDRERQEALRRALHRRLGSPSGPFRLVACAWYARGLA